MGLKHPSWVVAASQRRYEVYRYSIYGERTKQSGSADSDFGFAGLFHHEPSGLDLATSRLYDSRQRRFISRDPLGEAVDYNLYRYANNNPVNFTDPLGLETGDPTTGTQLLKDAFFGTFNTDNAKKFGTSLLEALSLMSPKGHVVDTAIGAAGEGSGDAAHHVIGPIIGGKKGRVRRLLQNADTPTVNVTSRIKDSGFLVRQANAAGRNQQVQQGLDALVHQLQRGNPNPGTGTKFLFNGVFEARHRSGARVYFRNTDCGGIEILGKSSKSNQGRVINELRSLYGD